MSEKRVLISTRVFDNTLSEFDSIFEGVYEIVSSQNKKEALELAKTAEVLVMIAPSQDIISAAHGCKWIHTLTAGVETFLNLDAVSNNPGIILTNSSGVHAIPMSEHVFAMLLMFARRMKTSVVNQQASKWVQPLSVESHETFELYGTTIGIAGLGNIGMEIAKKAKSFGMRVIGTKRNHSNLKDASYAEYVDEILPPSRLYEFLEQSDFIVNSLPYTQETKHLFDAVKFSRFKQGSIFVNIGRGETVVESDLIDALRSQKIKFAALDVFETEPLPQDSPLWKMDNVLISPHYAGWSPLYFERAYKILIENLWRYSRNEKLINLVDRNRGY